MKGKHRQELVQTGVWKGMGKSMRNKYRQVVGYSNLRSSLLRCGTRPYEWGTQ